MRIGLDAGHPSRNGDRGVVWRDARDVIQFEEYKFTYWLAEQLRTLLRNLGHEVVLARSYSEEIVTLRERAHRLGGCDLNVSLHVDHNEDPRVSGMRTYYFEEPSLICGDGILEAYPVDGYYIRNDVPRLSSKSALKARPHPHWTSRVYNVLSQHHVFPRQIPSVLVECGFISSPDDRERFRSKEGCDLIASAIIAGIARFAVWHDSQARDDFLNPRRFPKP